MPVLHIKAVTMMTSVKDTILITFVSCVCVALKIPLYFAKFISLFPIQVLSLMAGSTLVCSQLSAHLHQGSRWCLLHWMSSLNFQMIHHEMLFCKASSLSWDDYDMMSLGLAFKVQVSDHEIHRTTENIMCLHQISIVHHSLELGASSIASTELPEVNSVQLGHGRLILLTIACNERVWFYQSINYM